MNVDSIIRMVSQHAENNVCERKFFERIEGISGNTETNLKWSSD